MMRRVTSVLMTVRSLLVALALGLVCFTAAAQVVGGPPTALPDARASVAYGPLAINLAACSGQCSNYQVNLGALPSALAVNPSTGVLSGTPTQSGAFTFQVIANVNAQVVAGGRFSLTVIPPIQGAPISTPALLLLVVGLAATGARLMRRPRTQ